ncbi:MAG: glycosyltransferase family 9 protein, partial [Nitrospirae bacterium]
ALFLGHDSGLTHLAAVLGVPTIALFGPTDPTRWGPRGKRVTILRGPLCQCSNWEAVQQCFPKPCLNFSVDQVLAAMRQYLPG